MRELHLPLQAIKPIQGLEGITVSILRPLTALRTIWTTKGGMGCIYCDSGSEKDLGRNRPGSMPGAPWLPRKKDRKEQGGATLSYPYRLCRASTHLHSPPLFVNRVAPPFGLSTLRRGGPLINYNCNISNLDSPYGAATPCRRPSQRDCAAHHALLRGGITSGVAY